MQTKTCLPQKSVKINIYLNDISLTNDFICAQNEQRKNIRVCHLTICILLRMLKRSTYVELIVAQRESTEAAHFITKQENYLLSH
jgi:hypothetical protein